MQTVKVKAEKRADVAAAIIQHVLHVVKSGETVCAPSPGCDLHIRKDLGSFSCMRCVPHYPQRSPMDVGETVDVWLTGTGKVFSARPDIGGDWQIITFKRGDWETAFLMTQ